MPSWVVPSLPRSSSLLFSLSVVSDSATPWTVTHQVHLSMGFSRQEYWSGLPVPSPRDLSNSGMEPESPALLVESLPSEWPGWVVSNGGPESDLRDVDTTDSETRRDRPFCGGVTVIFSIANYIRYFIPTKWNLWVQLLSYINSMHIYWAHSTCQVQLGLWQRTGQACSLAFWSLYSGGLSF